MDILTRYFFVTRSFLFGLPITFLLAGYALETFAQIRESSQLPSSRLSINRAITGLILISLVGLSLITYIQNQPIEKSNARSIAAYLHQAWHPGDNLWVRIPSWEPLTYMFYLDVYFKDNRMGETIYSYEWSNIPNPDQTLGQVFLITERPNSDQIKKLETFGYTPINDLKGPNWLWVHSNYNPMLRRFSVTFSLFSMVLDGILAGFALRISGPIRPLLNGLPGVADVPLPHPPAGRAVLPLPAHLGGHHAGLRRVRWAQEPARGG